MKFEKWFLEWRGLSRKNTQVKLAGLIDTAPSNLHKLLGGSIPAPEIMANIKKVTKGKVQPNDFYL